jgi:hypothetical protein
LKGTEQGNALTREGEALKQDGVRQGLSVHPDLVREERKGRQANAAVGVIVRHRETLKSGRLIRRTLCTGPHPVVEPPIAGS